MKRRLLAATFLALLVSSAPGHNNLFFPGDAFFSTKFDRGFMGERAAPGTLSLDYERFVGTTAKCGYAGYEKLSIKQVPDKMLGNLNGLHKFVFGAGGGARVPLPLFVYNRDFPLSSPFGVKYNERWQEVQVEEAKLERAIYDELGGAEFIIDDWASAKDIAPLAVGAGRAPMVKPDGQTGVVEQALEIEASEVMLVVLVGGDAEVVRFARREEGLVFFVVTEEVRRYRFDRKGVAMPQKIDAPLDDMAQKRRLIAQHHAEIRAALKVYELNVGALPSKAQGLDSLVDEPAGGAPGGWMPVLKKLPLDPWGKPYQWDGDVIFSLGADGVESEDDVVEPFAFTEDGIEIPPPNGED